MFFKLLLSYFLVNPKLESCLRNLLNLSGFITSFAMDQSSLSGKSFMPFFFIDKEYNIHIYYKIDKEYNIYNKFPVLYNKIFLQHVTYIKTNI